MGEVLEVKDGVIIMLNDNRCVMCGEIIPEGRQVCYICERKANERQTDPDEKVSSKVQRHGVESTERMASDSRVQ